MTYSLFDYLRVSMSWRCSTSFMAKQLRGGKNDIPWDEWYDWLDLKWEHGGYLWWKGRRKYKEKLGDQLNELVYVLKHSPKEYAALHNDVLQQFSSHFIWHDIEEAKSTLLKYAVEFVQRDPEHLFVFLQGYLDTHSVLHYLTHNIDIDTVKRRQLLSRVYIALVTHDRRKVVEWLSLEERHAHMVAALQALHMLAQELLISDNIPYPELDEGDDAYSLRITQLFFPCDVCSSPLPSTVVFS